MLRIETVLAGLFWLFAGLPSLASEPQVLAAGDWSKPVADMRGHALRGRLVVCEKQVSDERREVAVYVELQDASEAVGREAQLFCEFGRTDFRPEYKQGLRCELRTKDKELVKSTSFPFGGGIPASQWVTLPSDGTIRLRASPFGIHRPAAIAICPDVGTLWILEPEDKNDYFLSGTFTIDPAADRMPPGEGHVWRGTLELPAARLGNAVK
jgi:hypothetical protein